MPPRRSTRTSTASTRAASARRRRLQDDEDEDEVDHTQHTNDADQDDDEEQEEEEEEQPARRGGRRSSHQAKRTYAVSRRTASSTVASKRRRTNDEDEDGDGAPNDDNDDDGQEGDVTVVSARSTTGRRSIAHNEAEQGSDAEGAGDDAKWALLAKKEVGEFPDTVKKAARELGKQDVLSKAGDLCRLALYHEYNKAPLRRPLISQHIFNNDTRAARALPMVLRYTNKTLRRTFGLELIEMKTGVSATTSSFILRSVLPAAAIETLVKPSRELQDHAKEVASGGGGGGGARAGASGRNKRGRSSAAGGEGSADASEYVGAEERKKYVGLRTADPSAPLLDWKAADGQLGGMGLLYVILALILTNGRTLPNSQLRSQLRRLCLPAGEPLPIQLRLDGCQETDAKFPERSNLLSGAPKSMAAEASYATIDSFLALAVKHHYLEHAKSSQLVTGAGGVGGGGTGVGEATSGKGRKGRAAGDDADAAFDWKWGARSYLEVGEPAIAQFIAEIWGLGASREDREEEAAAAETRQFIDDAGEQLDDDDEEDDEDDDEEGGGGGGGSSSRRTARQREKARAKTNTGRKSASQRTTEQRAEREARLLRDIERAAGSQLV